MMAERIKQIQLKTNFILDMDVNSPKNNNCGSTPHIPIVGLAYAHEFHVLSLSGRRDWLRVE